MSLNPVSLNPVSLNLDDTKFAGPALPEPFVKFQLEDKLRTRGLLSAASALCDSFKGYRRRLRDLADRGGAVRVANHVLEPLTERLRYLSFERQDVIATREGAEDGGWLFGNGSGPGLRAWAVEAGTDLDAPGRRGRAYRFSPARIAQRVLLAKGERAGLLTDGLELRLLLCDPARPDSHVAFRLDRSGGWRGARPVPDSYRLLVALASPPGVAELPKLTEEARLAQTAVTRRLREQARQAIEAFVQATLAEPRNRAAIAAQDPAALAGRLWAESLVLIYRLLFILKLESSPDPARAFSFASTSLWRKTWSPRLALAPVVRKVIDGGAETGAFLESSLRALFRLFTDGVQSSELRVSPLGGMLFGPDTTPTLDGLAWGESAVARLIDHLLWTPGGSAGERHRVYYGSLDVEDLGRVYEALLELEPGIAAEPMCRLRRAKLEVVVPAAQGERYRASKAPAARTADDDADEGDDADTADEDEAPKKGKTQVQWIEDIPRGRFYLRVGLGRKATGSYYTPHPFVRFLVQETLEPQVAERSPKDDPRPAELLKLKVLDPAMGSGHFLVEACRFLGDALYEACRLADELAADAESKADATTGAAERERLLARATELRERVTALPDPDDELVRYLPSRAPEGEESGLSQWKALAISRRLVAVHCLYGVDKNLLAVELAKLSLWLESYAEGLPLTFLDHRLVCGDSLTGPFVEHLTTYPGSAKPIPGLFIASLHARLKERLSTALAHVRDLEATVGKDVADLVQKRAAKERLDAALAPFRTLAAVWSGGVMLGAATGADAAYERLLGVVASDGDWSGEIARSDRLHRMHDTGRAGVPYDLAFPEVFHPGGQVTRMGGFDAVVGNPPWDRMLPADKEFFAGFDLQTLDAPTKRERDAIQRRLAQRPSVAADYAAYVSSFRAAERIAKRTYRWQSVELEGKMTIGKPDAYRLFMERGALVLRPGGFVGLVVPAAFHAAEGATGLRRLYLEDLKIRGCYSFENRRKLFDIDSRFKFAAVIAQHSNQVSEFDCAFYLHDLEWLFGPRECHRYSLEFVRQTTGPYLSFLEFRTSADAAVARTAFSVGRPLGVWAEASRVRLGRELNMTDDAHRFTPAADILDATTDVRVHEAAAAVRDRGYLPLHEGKTFHQYDDCWGDPPRYLIHLDTVRDRPAWLSAARHYRLAFRGIASSTNERTGIFCLLPPGVLVGHAAPCEREPGLRPSAVVLALLAAVNTYAFDWVLRQKTTVNVSLFILNACAVPPLGLDSVAGLYLVHAAVRLTCNHPGYAALWQEQIGDAWRETQPPFTWPVVEGNDARWAVRAVIDAVVADAYGLSREQYVHVLSTFSHSSYAKAPELCLAAFDELKATGIEAFTRQHDPYWDIPLNESLPQPVIELPIPAGVGMGADEAGPLFAQPHLGGASLTAVGDLPLAADGPAAYPGRAGRAHKPTAALDHTVLDALRRGLASQGVLSSAEARQATGLGAAAVRPYLERLVADGVAVKQGAGRGTRYRLAGQIEE